MPFTNQQVNDAVNQIVNEYTGKSIAYYGTYQNQCSVPAAYYVEKLTSQHAPTMATGNADGWGKQPPASLRPHFIFEPYRLGKAYPRGTLLMWSSPHIALVLNHNGSNNVDVFQQNADPDGAPCKSVTREINNKWHTCTWAMIPIIQAPAPVPPPITYHTEYINATARDLLTTKNPTNWYELTGEFSPLTTLPEGTRVPVAGIAHWSSSTGETHDFYMTPDDFGDAGRTQVPNKNNGISTDDLKEVPPPTPYKAPEVLYNIQDKMAEKYTLVTDLLCYKTSINALTETTPVKELVRTDKKNDIEYYVHGRDREMINISRNNMDRDVAQWINPRKNVVAVEEVKPVPVVVAPVAVPEKIIQAITTAAEKIPPAPVTPAVPAGPTPQQEWQQIATELAQHLSLFNLDGSPVHYNSNNSRKLFIEDMTGALDSRTGKVAVTTIAPFTKHIPMVGTIDIIEDDGRKIRYVLPAACYGTSKWYLAPMSSFNLDKKTVLDKAVDVVEGIYNDIRTSDHLTAAQERIKLSIQGFVNKMKKD